MRSFSRGKERNLVVVCRDENKVKLISSVL